jgi:hypothetical protein
MLSPTEKEGEQLEGTAASLMQSTLAGPNAGLTQSTLLVKSDSSTGSGSTSPREPSQRVRFHKSPAFADIMKRLEAAVPGADDKDPLWQAIARHQAKASDRHWVPDDARHQCEECGGAFEGGMTTSSKHHCRHCGDVYCGTCAPERDPLPGDLPPSTVGRVEEEQSYSAMGKGWAAYVTGAAGDASRYRRCVSCERLCAALTGDQSKEALRKWQAVEATQQLLNHRHILYRLPYHPISAEVKARLRELFLDPEREYVFTGHSGFVV